MTSNLFTVDINEKYTRLVDLSFSNGKITLESVGVENTISNFYSDDTEKSIENQAEIISKLCSDLKINKKNVHVVIPDSQSFSQILEFPKLNEKELLSAVRYQSDQFIPMPIEEIVLDIEILKEDKERNKNTILIIASPKKTVDRVEKAIEYAGLSPESLENELSAFGRFYSEVLAPQQKGATIIVNFGFTNTSLYLVDAKSSLILMNRNLKLGLDLFLKELRFNFELPETKALDVLKTIGFEKNASYDVSTITAPILRELLNETAKFILLAKEKFALPITKIYCYNHNNQILAFEKKITELLSLPAESLLIREQLIPNPLSQSFSTDMSSFISGMGGAIR